MSNNQCVVLTVCSVVLGLSITANAQTKIPVGRHSNTTINDKQAKSMLEGGSSSLKIEGTPNKCGLNLTLKPPVGVFQVGDGSITSSAQYQQVCSTGGYIHVVSSIGWCGGTTVTPGFTIIGCSDTPGSCEVVARLDDPTEEPSLWMHEYGHTKGLQHRAGSLLLMNPTLSAAGQVYVSQSECGALKRPQVHIQSGKSLNNQQSVEEFVSKLYIEGLPVDQARLYQASDIPILLEMLVDDSKAKFWPNVVAVLGAIGDDATIPSLTRFLSKQNDIAPLATNRAKLQVPVSLGYMLHERASRRALELLETWSEPGASTELKSYLQGNNEPSAAVQFQKSAVIGLGVSGNPDALRFLQRLLIQTRALGANDSMTETVHSAIGTNRKVARTGLH